LEVAAYAAVELPGEQRRDAAPPWVRRLRHDDVIWPARGGKERLGILVVDVAALVLEYAADAREIGLARGIDHERLELDGIERLDPAAEQQRARRQPGAEADVCNAPRSGMHAERECRREHHGDLVARGRTGVHADRCV